MADNPFANSYQAILDPNQGGTIMGAIGGLMGAPTARQAQGSATGNALKELSALRDQGLPPQQALIKFLQTPGGQEFFTNAGPDGLKTLVDGLAATQPPAPTLHNLGKGGQLYATQPGQTEAKLVANNPETFAPTKAGPGEMLFDRNGNKLAENTNAPQDTAEIQNFKFYTSQISKLPKAEIERLALLKLDPGKTTAATEAIDTLVKNYGLDARTGEALKAGALSIQPILNSAGQDTGLRTIVDLTSPGGPKSMLINSQSENITPGSTPSAQPVPGSTPASGAATGKLPAATPADVPTVNNSKTTGNPSFGTKADMALGSSPVSKVLGAATKVSEAINPRLIIESGAQANDRETMLNSLRSNLQAIGTIGGGFSSNKGLIQGYVDTYLDRGFFTSSPHSQVQKLIRLNEVANQNIQEETQRYNDSTQPNEVKKQAAETVAGWQRVLKSMPTYDQLISQEKAIREGKAGAPTVSGAVNTMIESGAKALTEGKRQAQEVQTANPNMTGGTAIEAMTDQQLLQTDPRSLKREDQIKFLRRLDKMQKSRSTNGSTVAR